MFAVTATGLSPSDPLAGLTLGERPEPQPAPGWEIVQVVAASLNHHDLWTLRGVGMTADRLPIVLGCDAAGVTSDGREVVVHAVVGGPDSVDGSEFSILSERYDGTFADLVAVPRANLIDKPPELSFEEAACLPTAWLTAYRALFVAGGLRPGGRLLIQGAGGGVSTAAVALGRAAGARVYVTSRDEAKRQRALELGAHEALESGARVPERVDLVLESVGEATWSHSLKSLDAGGSIVVVGATSGAEPSADLRRVFYRQLRVIGSTMGTRADLVSLVRFLVATGVRPVIDRVWPMDEARGAFEQLASGEVFGKIVLTRAV